MTRFNNFKRSHAQGLLLASALSLTLFAQNVVAAESKGYKNYVTDSIENPVRRGAGYKYKINHMLVSGTPVTILEVDKDGWANVKYQFNNKNYTGWMPTSVLQNEPIARTRLEEQINKTSAVEQKLNALQIELDTLKTRFGESSEELSTVKQEKFELSQELTRLKSISNNAFELDQENQAMKQRLGELEDQNAIMKEQFDQSDDSIKRQWFLTGSAVLLMGLLLGRFFRVPNKRKRWDAL